MSIAATPWSSPLTNTWKVPSRCLCTPILVLACKVYSRFNNVPKILAILYRLDILEKRLLWEKIAPASRRVSEVLRNYTSQNLIEWLSRLKIDLINVNCSHVRKEKQLNLQSIQTVSIVFFNYHSVFHHTGASHQPSSISQLQCRGRNSQQWNGFSCDADRDGARPLITGHFVYNNLKWKWVSYSWLCPDLIHQRFCFT